MVQLRTFFTSVALLLFIFLSSALLHSASAAGARVGEKRVRESRGMWQRKPWMNHGSFRGPRKQFINPKVEHLFQVRELPV
ncbi:hypothetical protein RHMOL_Rhmol11G0076600 [Rhododendron molle]|uniref:Uncharacterized protein n=1 Tax=Rhododendron molle TaxID=49168 RepID=A0ACC0LPU6_RHOML|nr:hypothetical protein RHMOL_Rhmol11G0076600 [Rhododendron molle]